MKKGMVTFFHNKKGYGFIQSNDESYFVHASNIERKGVKSLKKNQVVTFEEEVTEKGKQAIHVKIFNENRENLKQLQRKLINLVLTHSPSIETDNLLSGEMDKYYFEYPVKCQLKKGKVHLVEENSNENIQLELSDIAEVSPISKNDSIIFSQKYVCALLYKDGEVITLYFD